MEAGDLAGKQLDLAVFKFLSHKYLLGKRPGPTFKTVKQK